MDHSAHWTVPQVRVGSTNGYLTSLRQKRLKQIGPGTRRRAYLGPTGKNRKTLSVEIPMSTFATAHGQD